MMKGTISKYYVRYNAEHTFKSRTGEVKANPCLQTSLLISREKPREVLVFGLLLAFGLVDVAVVAF